MRIIVQKAIDASVTVDSQVIGHIEHGFVLLVGFTQTDTQADLTYLANKVANLRIYPDTLGKMNVSIKAAGGAILSISQFTVYGDATEGNRPSFTAAAPGEIANRLFNCFNDILRHDYGLSVQTGQFGAHMLVNFTNDGPVTILLESKKKTL
ncbi:MAG: D-aminoacyl-tRNA deacylase [Candidatus Izemoplasmatales bacterium]|nr:D-aminoacyl-tRNA deacylase [Candidatus Izemoplasmatales bacterium]